MSAQPMTTQAVTALFPRAFSRFRFSVIALQWGGNLLTLFLAAAWLQIPDSHAWQFVFSIILAAILAIGFCWLQMATFSRLRPQFQPATVWLRVLGFALVAALWILLAQWISSGNDGIPNYAYLWNSKLSPGMRVTFSPARIIAGLGILLNVMIWAITGMLLPIGIMARCPSPLLQNPLLDCRLRFLHPHHPVHVGPGFVEAWQERFGRSLQRPHAPGDRLHHRYSALVPAARVHRCLDGLPAGTGARACPPVITTDSGTIPDRSHCRTWSNPLRAISACANMPARA
jgi:hypothetical protein